VPALSQAVELVVGDHFVLAGDLVPGQPALRGAADEVVHPAIVPCTLPQALDHLAPGERVLFDDGRIEALVESVQVPRATLRVVRAGGGRARLRAEKGINFPETRLEVDAVTEQDRRHLSFAARHADAVGLSFLRTAADVRRATQAVREAEALAERPPGRPLGVVIKVETRSAFDQLPALLLAAMESFPAGVMIARGDLAVEIGFERLAEVQEEILWLCEAAHLPSIWATQVLDELAQTGVPSRAEVTDASMAVRAECVMLNKGPFVDRAVRVLDDILRRMEHHTYKKRALYRRLSISDALVPGAGGGGPAQPS
jgi:pyruvate kinase